MSDLSTYPAEWPEVAERVKEEAGWRCVRCGHPHETPRIHTPCDSKCDWTRHPEIVSLTVYDGQTSVAMSAVLDSRGWRQRVLTVHHLDGNKHNLSWWNLVALCQVCHLYIQGKVIMDRPWAMFEHSEWFKPYVAGFYAHRYLGEELCREEVLARLDELLALEGPLTFHTWLDKESKE